MIPTSIDGTDITGATIDGQDVQEITVDGQTVFTAGPTLPVAYSNLVAWYPFDSAEYGGSNADDVTAILAGSGDNTAYDGTVSGATYQSSGGVTDINAGANSGAYDFGQDHFIQTGYDQAKDAFTYTAWFNPDVVASGYSPILGNFEGSSTNWTRISIYDNEAAFTVDVAGNLVIVSGPTLSAGEWYHIAGVRDSNGDMTLYVDGSSVATGSNLSNTIPHTNNERIGLRADGSTVEQFDGTIEDVRIYDKALSSSEVSQIVSNTPHP